MGQFDEGQGDRRREVPQMADPKHPRKFSEEFKRQIVQLHDNGKPVGEIEREYDLAHSTVHRWIRAIHSAECGHAIVISDEPTTPKFM